jgi:hypothetical protein
MRPFSKISVIRGQGIKMDGNISMISYPLLNSSILVISWELYNLRLKTALQGDLCPPFHVGVWGRCKKLFFKGKSGDLSFIVRKSGVFYL